MARSPFVISDAPHGPLRGDVYLPEKAEGVPVVVACHGFKGFKDWGFWPLLGERMAAGGVALVTFNLSGSGIGEDPQAFTEMAAFENNTIGKEIDDLGRVIDAVHRGEVPIGPADPLRMGLLGHSRGGGVSLVRAGQDPRVRSLVTWASISGFDRFDEPTKAQWRESGHLEVLNARTGQVFRLGLGLLEDFEAHRDDYDPTRAAGRLEIPTLLLHGTEDEAVSVEDGHRLAAALSPGIGELVLIEGAGHTFGATHPLHEEPDSLRRVIDLTRGWFQKTLA